MIFGATRSLSPVYNFLHFFLQNVYRISLCPQGCYPMDRAYHKPETLFEKFPALAMSEDHIHLGYQSFRRLIGKSQILLLDFPPTFSENLLAKDVPLSPSIQDKNKRPIRKKWTLLPRKMTKIRKITPIFIWMQKCRFSLKGWEWELTFSQLRTEKWVWNEKKRKCWIPQFSPLN